ncbi:MAG: hypothetical protein NT062_31430, partial [Proteobacteria bacterium]|nr:hypothetical protein [Pseudomonadota bacterium]
MSNGVTTFASYALAIGGMIAMLGIAISALQSNLQYPPAKFMLMNLLRTNPRQAEYVCAQMPKTFFEAIGGAMKAVISCQSTDPMIVLAASKPGFDGGVAMVNAYWNGLMLKTKMGAGAAGASIALVMSNGWPPIPVMVCAFIAGLAALYLLYRKHEVERT